jgi:hypothetical protein
MTERLQVCKAAYIPSSDTLGAPHPSSSRIVIIPVRLTA